MDRVLSRFTPASGITPHFGSIRRPSSGIVFAQSSRTWQVRRPQDRHHRAGSGKCGSAADHPGAAMRKEFQTRTLGDTCEMYQPKTISGNEMVADGAYVVFGANHVPRRDVRFSEHVRTQFVDHRERDGGSPQERRD